jgi:multidrug efflux pump subunit AcrB
VAAERGTNELVGAVVGSTLTTVVVFVPWRMLQGMVGQFFAALSLTLSGASCSRWFTRCSSSRCPAGCSADSKV